MYEIDVSECEYYDENKHFTCLKDNAYRCEECKNCHFKRLQCYKQELEKIKQLMSIYCKTCLKNPEHIHCYECFHHLILNALDRANKI